MTSRHLSPAEAAERGLLCKKDLKALGLMPALAKPAATVWQGRSAYNVYAPAECVPYARQPSPALLRRREAAREAAEWLDGGAVIIDTETTGLDGAEIVEIAILSADGHVLLDTLIRPTKPIPAEAASIHGITDEMVASAPSWAEVYERYLAAVRGKVVIAYNADFDAAMVANSCRAHGIEPEIGDWRCAMRLYARWVGEPGSRYRYRFHKLTAAASACGVEPTGAHRALADARMALGVIRTLSRRKSGRLRAAGR